MENTRFDYSPIINRKPFKLPDRAKVAIWVIVNIEYFDMVAPLPGSGENKAGPDVPNFSRREYGARVGIWRLMEVLDKHNIKATASLNSEVCQHYPVIIEECKKRGWEFIGHGVTNSRRLYGLSEDEERKVIKSSLDTISQSVGQRPRGWRSPGMAETFNTPDILAEEGIRYLSDWYNDDQPYPMKVKKGNLLSMPATSDTSDIQVLITQQLAPAQFCEILKDHFDIVYAEGADQARVIGISLHPFVIGTPSRIGSLDKALQYIKSHEGVWFATGWEIASWYNKNHLGIEESQI